MMCDENFIRDVEENGIKQPLLVLWDGTIINGWRRYRQAKRLGLATVPVVILDMPIIEWTLDRFKDPYKDVRDA